MTESEAIEKLQIIRPYVEIIPQRAEALDMAITALEDVQKYRLIGTVGEYIDAVVKQEAKMVCGIHESESPEDIEAYGKGTLFAGHYTAGSMERGCKMFMHESGFGLFW